MWWVCMSVVLCLANLTTGEEPKIVIVGAGASGIAAASKLYENGFRDVTILEAENRIGGRVYTIWFDESWVDLGGQWVHGQTDNIVFELAEPLGLLEIPDGTPATTNLYDSQGTLIPRSISDALVKVYLNALETGFEDLKGNNGSLGEYLTRTIYEAASKIPGVNGTLVREFIRVSEGLENAEDAADNWFATSARGYVESETCPGSNIVNWKDRGYGTILDILMKKYPNPENELPVRNNTRLNAEVVKIDYNSTEGKVLVELIDGEKYTADHVIVTPSLGVLKERHATLFTPQLPELKIKTIKGLAIGAVGKLFMSFESPWWPENEFFILMWTASDRREYENDELKKWMLDVVAFSPVEHKPRLLYAWINGPGVRGMEALPESEVLKQTRELLQKFLGKTYNITAPTGLVRSTWYSNEHFRGSYSYRSMESESENVWAADLAAPLIVNDKPIVQFAGEATHPRYYANVHGAIETGFREANRLIDFYNVTVPK